MILFSSFNGALDAQMFLILMKSNLSIFFLWLIHMCPNYEFFAYPNSIDLILFVFLEML